MIVYCIYVQIDDAIFLPQNLSFSGIRRVNVRDVTIDVMHLENKDTQHKYRIQKKRRAITSIIDEGVKLPQWFFVLVSVF